MVDSLIPELLAAFLLLLTGLLGKHQSALKVALTDAERYLNAAETILVALDGQARVTLLNRKGYEVLGYENGALLGRNWFQACLPPTDYDSTNEQYQRVLNGEAALVEFCESRVVRQEAGTRLIAWHNTLLRNDTGDITGMFSAGEDITERRQVEEERQHLQAQFQQVQKMQSLGSLAGGVAHDMNNVLSAILGFASANLPNQPKDSPAYNAFNIISQAAIRGGKMVKSLLSFARQSPDEVEVLDINMLLREEAHLLERTTLSKVNLILDLAPNLRPIRGDSGALSNTFMNLCVNAVDAMSEHGTLTLQTRNVDQEQIEVLLQDNGSGMSPEVMKQAMDPFFTTKEAGKGTGMGLAMAYSTMRAHKGDIAIESELGLGTCVRLRFPACELAIQAIRQVPTSHPSPLSRSLTVLLVDDDALVLNATEAMLTGLGHRVVAALKGEEALTKLETGLAPDLVILDMNMPGLGGAGTLPLLRQRYPALQVILATGLADKVPWDLCKADPLVSLLAKPFGIVELRRHLLPFCRVT